MTKTAVLALLVLFLLVSPSYATLIHDYPFTTDASDAVGAANGTPTNGATVSGGNLLLDGLDDFVQFGLHIVPTSGNYSVALLARQTVPQSGHRELISQGSTGGPGFYIGHDPFGIIRVSDSWLSTGVPYPSDGQFHHFAVTVDAAAGNSRLYVDGLLSNSLGFAIATTTSGTATRLGRQFDPFAEFFGGALDDVRIYNHALSATEVAALTAPVPEPGTMLLLGSGLAGLGAQAWRRRSKPSEAHVGHELRRGRR